MPPDWLENKIVSALKAEGQERLPKKMVLIWWQQPTAAQEFGRMQ